MERTSVLPSLSPLSESPGYEVAAGVVQVPPPPRFRALMGQPSNVSIKPGRLADVPTGTAAQKAGLRYEAKVQQRFFTQFGSDYAVNPCLHFRDDSGWRTCIPDGIVARPGSRPRDRYCIIFEIKLQHCPEAWWQLEKLYRPVLEAFKRPAQHTSTGWQTWTIFCCEVCRSYDPVMPFPVKTRLIEDIEAYVRDPFPEFGVFVWRP